MAPRRLSRGTPAMLTTDEQERLVKLLDSNPGLVRDIETLTGKALDSLTFQQKVAAVHEFMEIGRGLAPFNAAVKAVRETHMLAADMRGEIALADRVTLLEQENERLREDRDRAVDQLREERALRVAEDAAPAMAVNS